MRGHIRKSAFQEDIECIWTISNTMGNYIVLHVEMDLPKTSYCSLAFIEIRSNGSKTVERLCESRRENENLPRGHSYEIRD
ncbi:hypothetical protein PMAYCL1PPCAC_27535, partial [Pristionchus mayeri]